MDEVGKAVGALEDQLREIIDVGVLGAIATEQKLTGETDTVNPSERGDRLFEHVVGGLVGVPLHSEVTQDEMETDRPREDEAQALVVLLPQLP